jgi:6,7-dimethyl-8-ribityllumazine synthase
MSGWGQPDLTSVDASGLRLGVVATRWHSELVEQMLDRTRAAAKECGVVDVLEARVSGSVELSVVAQALAARCDAVVALGVVVRGDTAHFEYVCKSVTEGLTRVALDASTPVAHGVLTVDSIGQARDRAGFDDSREDKGWSATVAALEAAVTLRDLPAPARRDREPSPLWSGGCTRSGRRSSRRRPSRGWPPNMRAPSAPRRRSPNCCTRCRC